MAKRLPGYFFMRLDLYSHGKINHKKSQGVLTLGITYLDIPNRSQGAIGIIAKFITRGTRNNTIENEGKLQSLEHYIKNSI